MDALRLARGMTDKYAAAGVDMGGGKAVIIGDPARDKSEALLRAVGRMVERLGGAYRTGEDVGTTLADMELIHRETDYVNTLPEYCGGVGDISEATALGCHESLRACAERAWGSGELDGRSVALQGLGMVGWRALKLLLDDGARVVVSDVDEAKVTRAREEFGVEAAAVGEIHALDVDIFAPYALGGVIDDHTLPQLRARVICGSANNVLQEARHAEALEQAGIVWGVDFMVNAGGAIYDADRLRKGGFVRERAMADVMRIGDRLREVFDTAAVEGVTPLVAAERIAERRIEAIRSLKAS
jgi:leucine dehydrogenase